MTTDNGTTLSTDALVERLFDSGMKALELFTVYIGDRLGLYIALAGGPGTPGELATRTNLNERYVREWLEQQAVAAILTVDDPSLPEDQRTYSLPSEHAEALIKPDSPYSIAPLARITVSLGSVMPKLLEAIRGGGGVEWAAYGTDAIEAQGDFNRPWLRGQLASEYLPAIPDIHARLNAEPPAKVLDMASGVGWCGISIAQGYPQVSVVGIDVDQSSIEHAQANAIEQEVAERVRFEARDGSGSLGGPYDLALIIEAVHDMANPVGILSSVREALAPGASLIVVDERVAPVFTAPGDEIERFMYSASVLCCLATGMAESPTVATGPSCGQALLSAMRKKLASRSLRFSKLWSIPFSASTVCDRKGSLSPRPAEKRRWQAWYSRCNTMSLIVRSMLPSTFRAYSDRAGGRPAFFQTPASNLSSMTAADGRQGNPDRREAMSRTIGPASKGFVAIAGAVVLAVTGLGLFAPAAYAAPNEQGGSRSCYAQEANGSYRSYPPGATITVVDPSGGKWSYRCNGTTGQWEPVPSALTGVTTRPTNVSATLVTTTATQASGTATFSNSNLGSLVR